jgi:uncharacterized protein
MTSSPAPASSELTGPIAPQERSAVLDVVRGFALLGILLMNMPGFSTSFFAGADGSHVWTGQLHRIAESMRDILFSGKFNSILSLLFGLGFTLQLGRMTAQSPWGGLALASARDKFPPAPAAHDSHHDRPAHRESS